MRRIRDQAIVQRAEHKRLLLHRRLAKVSAASRTVASCLIANAAARRRERFRLSRAAVAVVRGRMGLAGRWYNKSAVDLEGGLLLARGPSTCQYLFGRGLGEDEPSAVDIVSDLNN